jgi:hypothetical protein
MFYLAWILSLEVYCQDYYRDSIEINFGWSYEKPTDLSERIINETYHVFQTKRKIIDSCFSKMQTGDLNAVREIIKGDRELRRIKKYFTNLFDLNQLYYYSRIKELNLFNRFNFANYDSSTQITRVFYTSEEHFRNFEQIYHQTPDNPIPNERPVIHFKLRAKYLGVLSPNTYLAYELISLEKLN